MKKKIVLNEEQIGMITREVVTEMQLQEALQKISEDNENRKLLREGKMVKEGFFRNVGLAIPIYHSINIIIEKLNIDKSKPFAKWLLSAPVKAILSYYVARAMNNKIDNIGNNTQGQGNMMPAVMNEEVDEFNVGTTGVGVGVGAGAGMLGSIVLKVLAQNVLGIQGGPLLQIFTNPALMAGLGGIAGGVIGSNAQQGSFMDKATNFVNGQGWNASGNGQPQQQIGMGNAPDLSQPQQLQQPQQPQQPNPNNNQ